MTLVLPLYVRPVLVARPLDCSLTAFFDSRRVLWARPGACGLSPGLSPEVAWLVGTTPQLQPDGTHLWPSDHLGVASISGCTPIADATPLDGR